MPDQSKFAWLSTQSVLVDGLSDDALGLADFLKQTARKVSVLASDQHQQEPSRIAKLVTAGVTLIERGETKEPDFGDAKTMFVDLFTSPRSALIEEARKRNLTLSSLAEVIVKSQPNKTIGVTGSAGKTTTTYLISAVLRAGGLSARASTDDRFTPSGPGHAILASLPSLDDDTWRVVELTSHHLEYVSTTPHIAVVTNLFADHQDWHGSFDAYCDAKMRLLSFQGADDVAVLNYDNEVVRTRFAPIVKGRTVYFSMTDVPEADVFVSNGSIMARSGEGTSEVCAVSDLSMPRHHIPNALAATAAGIAAGVRLKSIAIALRGFKGLPQRGLVVGHVGSVAIHDDTIALSPKKALLGLEAFAFDDVIVVSGGALIAPGGEQCVSSDLEKADVQLYCAALGRKAKAVVLYGDGGRVIQEMLRNERQTQLLVDVAHDFEAALAKAVSHAAPIGKVLVAPLFYNLPSHLKQIIERAIQPGLKPVHHSTKPSNEIMMTVQDKPALATEAAPSVIYRSADWYDQLYPQALEWAQQSLEIVKTHADGQLEKVLDIGCGTGRALELFQGSGASAWGVDILPTMVAASQARCPDANVSLGDMRSLALDETFDAVISLGSVFAHALTDADVEATLGTIARLTRPGGLLVIHVLNGAAVLAGAVKPEDLSVGARADDGVYLGEATGTINRRNSRLVLKRIWRRDGKPVSEEQVEIRLMMPIEFQGWLDRAGFDVLAIADNAALEETNLDGQRLWVVARRRSSQR
ncbi:Mur ligase family protein [Phyllobacterium sophorae]|uniref:Uncharacterized protein n=1 Tax=Phyllobacterium sophorae TaxID=1520277 RepID=A0A2P7AQJ5_9HYPH|nr:Mur ligase family protein [Phyllobacterium sophorae]PSH56496.1 hypothetical protein CU103_29255 [Phyllobacterium sophorae]